MYNCDYTIIEYNLGYTSLKDYNKSNLKELGINLPEESYINIYVFPNIFNGIEKKFKIVKDNTASKSILLYLDIFNDSCFIDKIEVLGVKTPAAQ